MAIRFDLTDMQLMVNVHAVKSLTKAAEKSFLSLPAASNRIKNLENNLGTSLLYRSSQGVSLTPSGEAFVKHSMKVLAQLEHLNADMKEFAHGIKGKVRVFSNATAMSEFMPSVLSRYIQKNPDVSIELRERLSHKILQAISEGIADLGVVSGMNLNHSESSYGDIQFIPYRKSTLVLITPKHHELTKFKQVSFSETLGFDYIGLSEWSALHQFVLQEAEKLGLSLKFKVEVSGFEGICRMVAANAGIAIIPETVAQRQAEHITIIPLKDAWAVRQSYICFKDLNALPPFAQELVHLMQEDAEQATSDT